MRTPGKRRFGKVGLTDQAGKPVFGMDAKGPTAKPEDVEDYLRNLGAKDWGASLDVAVLPRKRKPTKVSAAAANDAEPSAERSTPKRSPPPPPPAEARSQAEAEDPRRQAVRRAAACRADPRLGHEIDEKQVRKNLAALKKAGETPLVATLDKNSSACAVSAPRW